MSALNLNLGTSASSLPASIPGGMLPPATLPSSLPQAAPGTLSPRRRVDAGLVHEPLNCACGSRLPLQVRLGLRSRTRPVFEGRWCCGTECLASRIGHAIRREASRDVSPKPHRHRIPLGLVLLSSGAITHEDLRRALDLQQGTSDRIGDVLTRVCGLSERKIAEALAIQWGCNIWNVGNVQPERIASIAPRVVLERSGMLPLRIGRERRISVAFTDGVDAQATFALQRIHDVPVDAGIAPETALIEAKNLVLQTDGVEVDETECADVPEMARLLTKTIQRLQPVETRWTRVHDLFWMRAWLEPAALAGGPSQREDVMDFIYRVRTPRIA